MWTFKLSMHALSIFCADLLYYFSQYVNILFFSVYVNLIICRIVFSIYTLFFLSSCFPERTQHTVKVLRFHISPLFQSFTRQNGHWRINLLPIPSNSAFQVYGIQILLPVPISIEICSKFSFIWVQFRLHSLCTQFSCLYP